MTLQSFGMFMWDEAEYASIARSLLRGEGFAISGQPNYYRLPILPATAAASMAISGAETDWIAKIPSLMFALLAISLVYIVVRSQYDMLTSICAAMLLGLFPAFWLYTAHLLTEMPFLVFFAGAVFFLYFSLYRDRRWLYACAVFMVLALLTRYTGALFAPIALLFFLFYYITERKAALQLLRSRELWLSFLLAIVLLLPWLLRQQMTFGDAFIGFRYAANQLSGYLPGVSMPWYFYLLGLPKMLSWAGLLIVGIGFFVAIYKRDRFVLHCMLAVGVIIIWHSFYRYKETRLVMAILPFVAVPAALAITQLMPKKIRFLHYGVAVSALVLVAVLAYFQVRLNFQYQITNGYPSFLQAMQRLKNVSKPDSIVVGPNKPQIAWYADRRVRNYPDKQAFAKLPASVEWAVITNFERGQKSYVAPLVKGLTRADLYRGNVVVFEDKRFTTILVRTHLLQKIAADNETNH